MSDKKTHPLLTVDEYNVLVQLIDLGSKQLGLQLFTSEAGATLKEAIGKLGNFVDVPSEEPTTSPEPSKD